MKEEKFLPLGSVVIVSGNVKKLLLIGRGVATVIDGQQKYFDYVACTYPEGLIGDTVLYVNHGDINEVVYKGYEDEDDRRMQENLNIHIADLFPA